MPHQLIYRSRLAAPRHLAGVPQLALHAGRRNEALGITGLLIRMGEYFLQVLEGPASAVMALYDAIAADPRHTAVVLIRSEPVARRRFQSWHYVPVDGQGARTVVQDLVQLDLGDDDEDRVCGIVESFMAGAWSDPRPAPTASTALVPRFGPAPGPVALPPPADATEVRFALQPIVEPGRRRVSSVEFLLRGPQGQAPTALLQGLSERQRHQQDLAWKALAFAEAARLDLQCRVAINLSPGALLSAPDAARALMAMAEAHGWAPGRVIVEITEEEAITQPDQFHLAVSDLKAAGFITAIDDFGAGHAGLSLLAQFQPDKVKIDRMLVQDIHRAGPRQAIVLAVLDCCRRLGITVVAEGIERAEELAWLQAAGVQRFQGFYFARPLVGAMPPVRWPAGDRGQALGAAVPRAWQTRVA
jgi:EAL domain-containing protein (putative c-di-GMP-specific phosphodiesterase class I)